MKKLLVCALILVAVCAWVIANPVSAASKTYQVSSLSDTVNQDGSTYTSNTSTIWIGNGSSTTASTSPGGQPLRAAPAM